MSLVNNVSHPEVFSYFEEISAIPHGSHNTDKITQYLISFAKELGLEYHTSGGNNLIIIKEAHPSKIGAPAIILQGHTDMVCEKTADTCFDFANDGLELYVEGDYLSARGTTLGGDDGVAVAIMMALLADKSMTLPRLECIFTYDEEVGMLGANNLDLSPCKASMMINLDSETEGEFITGCAGGVRLTGCFNLSREMQSGRLIRLSISGLMGGHSGEAIHMGGANAIKLMGRFVNRLTWGGAYLVDFSEGNADNVIPKSCSASLLLVGEDISWVAEYINTVEEFIHEEYDSIESNLNIEYSIDSEISNHLVVAKADARNIIDALIDLEDGVIDWEPKDSSQVQTSTNLGIVKLDDNSFTMHSLLRSSDNEAKSKLLSSMEKCIAYTGGKTSTSGSYSGWQPNPDSGLAKQLVSLWEDMYGVKPSVRSIHAGLECGILSGKRPELDIISLGPNIYDIHTPDELLDIPSTMKVYEFLIRFLQELK